MHVAFTETQWKRALQLYCSQLISNSNDIHVSHYAQTPRLLGPGIKRHFRIASWYTFHSKLREMWFVIILIVALSFAVLDKYTLLLK